MEVRAAIYTRVSIDDHRERRSVGEQEADCYQATEREGWTVNPDAVFADNDRSASRFARKTRPEFAELLTYLRGGNADVLVLWESSRGSRKLSEWALLLDLCHDGNIFIHVVTHHHTYDLRRARDMRTLSEDGVDSEYESGKTRERVLRALRGNATTGRPHGRLQFGYARRYDERGRFVEQYVVPEQAQVLREAARRVLAGDSCYAVAQDFQARGLPSPSGGEWIGADVKRLLVNPSYIGKRVFRGVVIGDAVWPAILDEADHRRLVVKLTDPARRLVEDPSVRYLLSGLVVCAECDGKFRVQKQPTKQGFKFSYICHQRFCVSVKLAWLDDFVTRVLLARFALPNAAVLFAPADADDASWVAAQREVEVLEGRLAEFVGQAASGKLSPSLLARVEAELAPQIADAKRRAQPPAPVTPEVLALSRPGVDVPATWARMDIVARRKVVSSTMSLRLDRGRAAARAFDPWRLAGSRWVGDPLTWGDHWSASGDVVARPHR